MCRRRVSGKYTVTLWRRWFVIRGSRSVTFRTFRSKVAPSATRTRTRTHTHLHANSTNKTYAHTTPLFSFFVTCKPKCMSHFLVLYMPTRVVHIINYESSRHILFSTPLLYVRSLRILLFVFSLCHRQYIFFLGMGGRDPHPTERKAN